MSGRASRENQRADKEEPPRVGTEFKEYFLNDAFTRIPAGTPTPSLLPSTDGVTHVERKLSDEPPLDDATVSPQDSLARQIQERRQKLQGSHITPEERQRLLREIDALTKVMDIQSTIHQAGKPTPQAAASLLPTAQGTPTSSAATFGIGIGAEEGISGSDKEKELINRVKILLEQLDKLGAAEDDPTHPEGGSEADRKELLDLIQPLIPQALEILERRGPGHWGKRGEANKAIIERLNTILFSVTPEPGTEHERLTKLAEMYFGPLPILSTDSELRLAEEALEKLKRHRFLGYGVVDPEEKQRRQAKLHRIEQLERLLTEKKTPEASARATIGELLYGDSWPFMQSQNIGATGFPPGRVLAALEAGRIDRETANRLLSEWREQNPDGVMPEPTGEAGRDILEANPGLWEATTGADAGGDLETGGAAPDLDGGAFEKYWDELYEAGDVLFGSVVDKVTGKITYQLDMNSVEDLNRWLQQPLPQDPMVVFGIRDDPNLGLITSDDQPVDSRIVGLVAYYKRLETHHSNNRIEIEKRRGFLLEQQDGLDEEKRIADQLQQALLTEKIDSAAELQFRLSEVELDNKKNKSREWLWDVRLSLLNSPDMLGMAQAMGWLSELEGATGSPFEIPTKASQQEVYSIVIGLTAEELKKKLPGIAMTTFWTVGDLQDLWKEYHAELAGTPGTRFFHASVQ